MLIIPAILALTWDEFTTALARVTGLAPYLHLDVMDGIFVPHQTFGEIERLAELPGLSRLELHLMVADPAAVVTRWQGVAGVFRALIHAEVADPGAGLLAARARGWETGLVLNPETPLAAADPFLPDLQVLQLMSVTPGAQGHLFHPEVKQKIADFTRRPKRPLAAVDGAVNKSNIRELQRLGVDIVNMGHNLLQAPDPRQEYQILQALTV